MPSGGGNEGLGELWWGGLSLARRRLWGERGVGERVASRLGCGWAFSFSISGAVGIASLRSPCGQPAAGYLRFSPVQRPTLSVVSLRLSVSPSLRLPLRVLRALRAKHFPQQDSGFQNQESYESFVEDFSIAFWA